MPNRSVPSKEELSKMYALGYSIKEIAHYLNMSVGKVYKYFNIYNIKTRKPGLNSDRLKENFRNKVVGRPSKRKGINLSEETKEKMRISKSNGIGAKSISPTGYVRIYFPDHPKSDKWGYILEHDLIMECNIGRWLQNDEIVHHKNGIKTDNRIKNLEIMTRSKHMQIHMKERKIKNVQSCNF